MPNLNGTGPNGAGAMTGRGLGNCSGNTTTINPVNFGRRLFNGVTRGIGMRRGGGRGFGGGGGGFRARNFSVMQQSVNNYVPESQQLTGEQEIEYLKNQAKSLENNLANIQARLNELEK